MRRFSLNSEYTGTETPDERPYTRQLQQGRNSLASRLLNQIPTAMSSHALSDNFYTEVFHSITDMLVVTSF